MAPELRHLRHFVAVAEELNFTRAAGRLFLAQQALSSSIKQLENELGQPLFVRDTRRVALTPAGETLLPRARRLLAMAEETVTAVQHGTPDRALLRVESRTAHRPPISASEPTVGTKPARSTCARAGGSQ